MDHLIEPRFLHTQLLQEFFPFGIRHRGDFGFDFRAGKNDLRPFLQSDLANRLNESSGRRQMLFVHICDVHDRLGGNEV